MSFVDKAVILGYGATEFSKNSGRSELRLAVEAVTAALNDAQVSPEEVDGLATFMMDNNDEQAVAGALGMTRVNFYARTSSGGGGGCGVLGLAAMAVESGRAQVVVCYRAMNERSQQRFGSPNRSTSHEPGALATSYELEKSWAAPFGLMTPAAGLAMSARRYMHQYGATSEDFGQVAVAARAHAATNPNARFYGQPITLQDHQQSRMICDPLRLYDCCQESDGAVAFIVVDPNRAKRAHAPVVISASAQAIAVPQYGVGSYYRDDTAESRETAMVAERLWQSSRLGPQDMDLAILYDHFSPAVLMQLEALGFCGPGQAPKFVRGEGIEVGGRLPVNTNGGQIGEAYIHGFNGIAEAVRQLRNSAVNQVAGAEHVVVTSGSHVPTSGLVLSRA